jgi:hypothetical protein
MRRLLLAPLILALFSPAMAGLPESLEKKEDEWKWMRINPNYQIDTEDVDMKGTKLRFYVERNALKSEFEGSDGVARSWVGKVRVSCDDFEQRIDKRQLTWTGLTAQVFGANTYVRGDWEGIRSDSIARPLASYFCFLTGVEGYTREEKEPDWVKKIIKTVQSKPIRKSNQANINCDSPAWRNRPQCIDY